MRQPQLALWSTKKEGRHQGGIPGFIVQEHKANIQIKLFRVKEGKRKEEVEGKKGKEG